MILPHDLRPLFNMTKRCFRLHQSLVDLDYERKYYEALTIQEQIELKSRVLDKLKYRVHDCGEKGAIEIAGKLGAFLRLCDPDNTCAQIYKNRSEAGFFSSLPKNPRIKE